MDYGSLLTYTVGLPSTPGKTNANLALKGVCIRLGGSNEAAVCFDADLLRYYAGWTGGFLDLSKTHLTSYKGSEYATIQGEVKFSTKLGPGWAKEDDFADPRALPAGPLPRERGQFKGLYRHGQPARRSSNCPTARRPTGSLFSGAPFTSTGPPSH